VSDLVDILTAQAQSELWDQVVDQHNADACDTCRQEGVPRHDDGSGQADAQA